MIQELSAVEHIRLRPGMYVGSLGNEGFINLMIHVCQEIITNSSKDNGKFEIRISNNQILLTFNEFSNIEIFHSFYGKENTKNLNKPISYCMYNLAAVALSSKFTAKIQSKSINSIQVITNGVQQEYTSKSGYYTDTFINYEFELDISIWGTLDIDFYELIKKFYDFSILNPKFTVFIQQGVNQILLDSREGLKKMTKTWNQTQHENSISINEEREGYHFIIEMHFSNRVFPENNFKSYANYQETKYHGSLMQGAINGAILAIEEAASKYETLNSLDHESIVHRLNIAAHIIGSDLNYGGNTRDCLNMDHIEEYAKELVYQGYINLLFSQSIEDLREFIEPFEKGWPYNHIKKKLGLPD